MNIHTLKYYNNKKKISEKLFATVVKSSDTSFLGIHINKMLKRSRKNEGKKLGSGCSKLC